MANVGTLDRVVRLIAGLVLIAASVVFSADVGMILTVVGAIVGVVLIGTSLMRFCPIYALVRISTKRDPAN